MESFLSTHAFVHCTRTSGAGRKCPSRSGNCWRNDIICLLSSGFEAPSAAMFMGIRRLLSVTAFPIRRKRHWKVSPQTADRHSSRVARGFHIEWFPHPRLFRQCERLSSSSSVSHWAARESGRLSRPRTDCRNSSHVAIRISPWQCVPADLQGEKISRVVDASGIFYVFCSPNIFQHQRRSHSPCAASKNSVSCLIMLYIRFLPRWPVSSGSWASYSSAWRSIFGTTCSNGISSRGSLARIPCRSM